MLEIYHAITHSMCVITIHFINDPLMSFPQFEKSLNSNKQKYLTLKSKQFGFFETLDKTFFRPNLDAFHLITGFSIKTLIQKNIVKY